MKNVGKIATTVLLSLVVSGAAYAQQTPAQTDPYFIGAPTMKYSEFPFPQVADGEIWVPDLKWQSATTVVQDSWNTYNAQHRPSTPLSFAEAKKQGRLSELLRAYEAYGRTSDAGVVELDIGEAYRFGLGGLPKDHGKAMEWLSRGADKRPITYWVMGQIAEKSEDPAIKNMKRAAHYYSKGAARGDLRSAAAMLTIASYPDKFPGAVLPEDAKLRYQVYLYELGYPDALQWLYTYLDRNYSNPAVAAFNVATFGNRDPSYLETGEFAEAIKARVRSGFVPAGCLRVMERIGTGNIGSASEKLTEGVFGCFGRQRGPVISKMLYANARNPSKPMLDGLTPYFAYQGVIDGEVPLALVGSMVYAGENSATGFGKNFKVKNHTQSSGMVKLMTAPALKRGLARQSDIDLVMGKAMGDEAVRCWNKSLSMAGVKWQDRETEANISRLMSRAASNKCTSIHSKAMELTGNQDFMEGQTATLRILRLAQQFNDERAAKLERDRIRTARNRASFRTSGSASSYTAPSGSGAAPTGAISSAEAYAASKRSVCASPTAKSSFCR